MLLHPFWGGRNGFGLSLLLGGERGKETFAVPLSGGPDSNDPRVIWGVVANGGESGGVIMANYVAALILYSVGTLHPFLHWHWRHRIGEEADGDILWTKFTRRWPLHSARAASPAPLGSVLLGGVSCRRGGRWASSLVRPNQGVGRPVLGAPRRYLPPRC